MYSHQQNSSKPLSGSHVFLMRLIGKLTGRSEVHDKGLLELKNIESHTIASERLCNNSASTEYHADAFLDHDRRSGDLI